jgi:peptidyl-dipeptidase Dcp
VRAGAKLSDADKAKLKATTPSWRQAANLRPERAEGNQRLGIVVDTREELAGMSDSGDRRRRRRRQGRGLDGKFVIALVNTSGQPPLAVLTNRATREKLMALSLAAAATAVSSTTAPWC